MKKKKRKERKRKEKLPMISLYQFHLLILNFDFQE